MFTCGVAGSMEINAEGKLINTWKHKNMECQNEPVSVHPKGETYNGRHFLGVPLRATSLPAPTS